MLALLVLCIRFRGYRGFAGIAVSAALSGLFTACVTFAGWFAIGFF